jgi:uncharacterized membrane protein YfhO
MVPANIMDEGQAILKKYSPLRIEVDVNTQKGTFLVNTTAYYKNWKVSIDGNPVKLYRVNYNGLGVYVPPGIHNVLFYYDEKDIYAGIILAVLSYLIFVMILSGYFKKLKVRINLKNNKKMI